MEEAFRDWFDRNKEVKNSMLTTEKIQFDAHWFGWAQVKWWKAQGRIIVKEIQLADEQRGKLSFTNFAVKMLSWHGVKCVELECVQARELIEKLRSRGWETPPGYEGNLRMTKLSRLTSQFEDTLPRMPDAVAASFSGW